MPKPEWLRIKARSTIDHKIVEEILDKFHLNTVCDEAACPNRGECFAKKTATFMILGNVCTRGCTFCNVSKGKPVPVDSDEPGNIAIAVASLGLKHAVITSVTRDDLPDGGSGHFAKVISEIKKEAQHITVEVLIPDFKGATEDLKKVINAKPDIINHNVETVPRLYSEVRPQANYHRSVDLLKKVKAMNKSIFTKSGIMLGLGETTDEILEVFKDLREANCDFLTVGQYLAPSSAHHPIVEYVHPDKFKMLREEAYEMGFLYVASGPFVRSSYMAEEALSHGKKQQ
ncbi:MAG: lipoyl synthase [Clostridiaceae bacterium]|nr:lipoyl synthase [Clostridiaceae bacterium]